MKNQERDTTKIILSKKRMEWSGKPFIVAEQGQLIQSQCLAKDLMCHNCGKKRALTEVLQKQEGKTRQEQKIQTNSRIWLADNYWTKTANLQSTHIQAHVKYWIMQLPWMERDTAYPLQRSTSWQNLKMCLKALVNCQEANQMPNPYKNLPKQCRKRGNRPIKTSWKYHAA